MGQTIRASDPRIHQIDISRLGFFAQRDLPPVELPPQHSPKEVAAPREETTSSRFSFEVKIDQFHFKEEEAPERPVELSDFEAKLDRLSTAHSPRLLVARINACSKEEEEMALNPRRGLRDLVAQRNGALSKDAPQTQLLPVPPLPLLPSPLDVHLDPNL